MTDQCNLCGGLHILPNKCLYTSNGETAPIDQAEAKKLINEYYNTNANYGVYGKYIEHMKYCLQCGSTVRSGTASKNNGHIELQIQDIVENPTVTDEFPNGAHLGIVARIVTKRRIERNMFWQKTSPYFATTVEARP